MLAELSTARPTLVILSSVCPLPDLRFETVIFRPLRHALTTIRGSPANAELALIGVPAANDPSIKTATTTSNRTRRLWTIFISPIHFKVSLLEGAVMALNAASLLCTNAPHTHGLIETAGD